MTIGRNDMLDPVEKGEEIKGDAFLRYNAFNGNDRCVKIKSISQDLQNIISNSKYTLDFDEETKIVRLTKKNAEIIENLFKNNDEYYPFAEKIFEYFGKDVVKDNRDKELFAVIREIDRDNSTNVWRYRVNRAQLYKLVEYISDGRNEFWMKLEAGDCNLPDELIGACGKGIKSLSSKVCKYLSEYAFGKDNYFINDKYVRCALLFYLDYYGVEHKELKTSSSVNNLSYKDLFKKLEALKQAAGKRHGQELTRNELDHIIWYCYKSFKA